jgi:predicted aspartyl protease
MEGYFRDDAPRMTLTLIGDGGQSDVEFVVDTAFTGMLTAPPFVLATVGAAIDGVRLIQLADGTERRAPFCTVRVEWFGELRIVCATIIDDEPLMGIDLLRGHHLHIEVTEGGEVAVEPL